MFGGSAPPDVTRGRDEVADQPRTDEDDDPGRPPGVTVPPWLRTGPTPGSPPPHSLAPVIGPPDSEGDGEAAPHRITLGARSVPAVPVVPAVRVEQSDRGDDLSSLPLRRAPGPPASPACPPTESTRRSPRPSSTTGTTMRPERPSRAALLTVGAVAIVVGSAVLGYVLTSGSPSPSEGGDAGPCGPVVEAGRVVGDGPGSPDTPAGVVLAFDHAFYVERSAEKAFALVASTSRMSESRLRTEGIGRLPQRTSHCVDARELSPTLLEVSLTETRPDTPPVLIRQRVRVAQQPDGTWQIVSITPAG